MLDFVQKNVIFLVINDAAFDFIMHVFYAGDEGVIQIFKVYADYMRAGNAFWEKLSFTISIKTDFPERLIPVMTLIKSTS